MAKLPRPPSQPPARPKPKEPRRMSRVQTMEVDKPRDYAVIRETKPPRRAGARKR